MSKICVTIPATTANLGAGFDCIGAALTLYNQFNFSPTDSGFSISVTGLEAERVKTDETNLVYQAFVKFYKYIDKVPPPVLIEINLDVPLARGLGSSATAIVGGLVGANLLAGSPLSENEVMELAIAMEGHPDNVVPALLGGCRLAASREENEPQRRREHREELEWVVCEVPWDEGVVPVVAIPDFELSTAEARGVLPREVSRADAIFNLAHFGLLIRGLETGRGDWLRAAMLDRLHQPYRQELIGGYDVVRSAAMAAGAFGMVISGAGPSVLALVGKEQAADVTVAMGEAWKTQGVMAIVRSLSIDSQGASWFTEELGG